MGATQDSSASACPLERPGTPFPSTMRGAVAAARGDATNDDSSDYQFQEPEAPGLPLSEVERLRTAMRRAFSLARSGAPQSGFEQLQGELQDAAARAKGQPWAAAVRRQWQLSLEAFQRLTALHGIPDSPDPKQHLDPRDPSDGGSAAPPHQGISGS
jgi:hypothetical protein